jgi:hypothetical protein
MDSATQTERCQPESQCTERTDNRGSDNTDQRFLQVDRKLRRTVLIACVVCIGIGAVLIQWGLPWAMRYLGQLEPEASLRVLQLMASLVFLGLLPAAWYLWSCGMRAVTFQQMPPPGMKVIKTVKVVTGDSAVARGKALMVVAALVATVSLTGGIWFPLNLPRFIPTPGPQDVSSRQSGRMDTTIEDPSLAHQQHRDL